MHGKYDEVSHKMFAQQQTGGSPEKIQIGSWLKQLLINYQSFDTLHAKLTGFILLCIL